MHRCQGSGGQQTVTSVAEQRTRNQTYRALKSMLDYIYPKNIYCVCCKDVMDKSRIHGICDRCIEKIDWATENPFENRMDEFSFDALYPCCRYGFYPRQIMHALKLKSSPYIADGIGKLMGERILLEKTKFDFVICVPMHKSKEERRGYNQAELLAREVSKTSGIPFFKGGLIKTKQTNSMRLANRDERAKLLENSFEVGNEFAKIIKDKSILLVDDVITTGITTDSCSRVLKTAGAGFVGVLCFASSNG